MKFRIETRPDGRVVLHADPEDELGECPLRVAPFESYLDAIEWLAEEYRTVGLECADAVELLLMLARLAVQWSAEVTG